MLQVPPRQRRRRRRLLSRRLLVALALIAVFVLGIAVGQALDDHPSPGGTITSVRTLSPLSQQPPTRTVTVQRDEEHNRYLLHVEDRSSGYPRQHTIGVDFVTAAEYRTLLANHRDLSAVDGDVVVAAVAGADGEEKFSDVRLQSLDAIVDFFITAGKKGVAINRYKGLGEMNPDQLWATTMNPEARTLLQVRAEDHTEADLMFTTLMGDQVEPRRKFIEDNALDVKNLDV